MLAVKNSGYWGWLERCTAIGVAILLIVVARSSNESRKLRVVDCKLNSAFVTMKVTDLQRVWGDLSQSRDGSAFARKQDHTQVAFVAKNSQFVRGLIGTLFTSDRTGPVSVGDSISRLQGLAVQCGAGATVINDNTILWHLPDGVIIFEVGSERINQIQLWVDEDRNSR